MIDALPSSSAPRVRARRTCPRLLLLLLLLAPLVIGGAATSAFPQATTPAASLTEALDAEIARIEAHARALESFAAEFRSAVENEEERLSATRNRVAELAGQLRILEPRSPETSTLYQRIVDELQQARPALARALDRLGTPASVETFEPRFDPTGFDLPSLRDRTTRFQRLLGDAAARRAALIVDEREWRRRAIEAWGPITRRLDELRIEAIENLPVAKRRQLLGVSREGFAQLGREVEQLKLAARLYRARQLTELDRLPARLLDVFAIGSLSWTLIKILGALALFLFLRRRGKRIRAAAYRIVERALATSRGRRRGELLVGLAEVVPRGACSCC